MFPPCRAFFVVSKENPAGPTIKKTSLPSFNRKSIRYFYFSTEWRASFTSLSSSSLYSAKFPRRRTETASEQRHCWNFQLRSYSVSIYTFLELNLPFQGDRIHLITGNRVVFQSCFPCRLNLLRYFHDRTFELAVWQIWNIVYLATTKPFVRTTQKLELVALKLIVNHKHREVYFRDWNQETI